MRPVSCSAAREDHPFNRSFTACEAIQPVLRGPPRSEESQGWSYHENAAILWRCRPYGAGMGERPTSVEVPDVVGMTGREAHAFCRGRGLFLGYCTMDQQLPQSMVIAYQEPPPGTMAAPAAAVRIWTALDPLPDDRRPR